MNSTERFLVVRKNGVSIYGRIVGKGGKLGRYEVEKDWMRNDGNVYFTYAEAESVFNYYISLKDNK